MADQSVIFKHGAKEIAWLNGYGLTFMAKPDHTWTGSSGHLHMSLWDKAAKRPLFHDAKATPYGMSTTMRHFLGGLMKYRSEEHTSELQSLMRISYAVFCLKKKKNKQHNTLRH